MTASNAVNGEIVVLALPYEQIAAAIEEHKDGLRGKVVIDITNPLDWSSLDRVVTPEGNSSGEETARLVPGARPSSRPSIPPSPEPWSQERWQVRPSKC